MSILTPEAHVKNLENWRLLFLITIAKLVAQLGYLRASSIDVISLKRLRKSYVGNGGVTFGLILLL